MSKVNDRVIKILNNYSSREIQKSYLTKPSAFSRPNKQIMSFEDMTIFVLSNTGKTLSLEVFDYFNNANKIESVITKQAISKQLKHIKYNFFEDLNLQFVKDTLLNNNLTFHNFNLIAVDGSSAEIPNCKKLKEIFGEARASKTSVSNARAGLNGFYDCENNLMVKLVVDKYHNGEKQAFLENIDEVLKVYENNNTVFIFDRGYICIELLLKLNEKGVKYLFRTPLSCYKKETSKATSNDEIIELELTKSRLKNFSEQEIKKYLEQNNIKERLVKVTLSTGESEYLITNLSTAEMPYEQMKELYFRRWEIEKTFDILKNKLHLENITSKSENGVKQEILATVFLGNIIEAISIEINESILKKDSNKYSYKLNVNILAGVIRGYFMYVLCTSTIPVDRKEQYYITLLKFIIKNVVAINKKRANPRIKRVSRNKHKTNLRNNM